MVPASVRCTPSTRMSRTVNGSNAHAGTAHAQAHTAASSAGTARRRSLGRTLIFVVRRGERSRSEQAGNVIEQCEGHENGQHGHTNSLADLESAVRNRAALEYFGEIIQQMPAIQ